MDSAKLRAVKLASDRSGCCGLVASFAPPPGVSTMKAYLQNIPGTEGADDELAASVIGALLAAHRARCNCDALWLPPPGPIRPLRPPPPPCAAHPPTPPAP